MLAESEARAGELECVRRGDAGAAASIHDEEEEEEEDENIKDKKKSKDSTISSNLENAYHDDSDALDHDDSDALDEEDSNDRTMLDSKSATISNTNDDDNSNVDYCTSMTTTRTMMVDYNEKIINTKSDYDEIDDETCVEILKTMNSNVDISSNTKIGNYGLFIYQIIISL